MTFRDIIEYIGLSLRDPKAAAAWAVGLNWPMRARWDALLLVTVLAVFLVQLTAIFEPVTLDVTIRSLHVNPMLALAVSQLVILASGALVIDRLGRMFGGQGDLAGALAIVTWLQVILLAINVVQIVLSLTVPFLAGLLSIVTFFLIFWLLANFIAQLHRFKSLSGVFVGMFLGMLGLALLLSVLLGILGVRVSMGA